MRRACFLWLVSSNQIFVNLNFSFKSSAFLNWMKLDCLLSLSQHSQTVIPHVFGLYLFLKWCIMFNRKALFDNFKLIQDIVWLWNKIYHQTPDYFHYHNHHVQETLLYIPLLVIHFSDFSSVLFPRCGFILGLHFTLSLQSKSAVYLLSLHLILPPVCSLKPNIWPVSYIFILIISQSLYKLKT